MSRIIIMILVAAIIIIPITFYALVAAWMVGNFKAALEKAGLSEKDIKAIATGKATIKKCE